MNSTDGSQSQAGQNNPWITGDPPRKPCCHDAGAGAAVEGTDGYRHQQRRARIPPQGQVDAVHQCHGRGDR